MNELYQKKVSQELFDYISTLSKEANLAGWFVNIEYCLWERMQEGAGRYYALDVNENIIARLKDYANNAGGWWTWENRKPVFLSLEEWIKLYERYPDRRVW